MFLAHNIDDQRVLLLATYRADEPASANRMHRLVEGVRRSGSRFVVEFGPLAEDAMAVLVAAQARDPLPPAVTNAIVTRSEGNPFFAEELVAAIGDERISLSSRLRDLLLMRVARLDSTTQSLLRLAAAAELEVGYTLLRESAQLPRRTVGASLRQAVEHGVLVADQACSSFRFRHALLAEAIYATILAGEREELHARLADQLARSGRRCRRSSRRTGPPQRRHLPRRLRARCRSHPRRSTLSRAGAGPGWLVQPARCEAGGSLCKRVRALGPESLT